MKIRTEMLMVVPGLVCLTLLSAHSAFAAAGSVARLNAAVDVVQEIMDTPDKAIPRDLFDASQCIVIIPGLKKAAFIVGGEYGKGFISCRQKTGTGWTAPGTVRIEGGSFGFQIGGAETDLVLLVMNKGGQDKLLSSQFTLGAGASVAAGPVGRAASAETDALMHAEILSWSRSHGVFAGISLQGATLRQDVSDNRELYGRTLENKEIIEKELPAPDEAKKLISLLEKHSPKKSPEKSAAVGAAALL